jgi:hypothetical protein
MNRTQILVTSAILIVVAMLGAWGIFTVVQQAKPANIIPPVTDLPVGATTTTPVAGGNVPVMSTKPLPSTSAHAYGTVTLALGQSAQFPNLMITPTVVDQDSRCPSGVQCIQAGTVTVEVKVLSSSGTNSTHALSIGQAYTTDTDSITLVSVQPAKHEGMLIPNVEYKFTFDVEKRVALAPCYVGGCSSEVCSDHPGQVSSCVYRAAYACYQKATCERQTTGTCGWTQTAALKACIAQSA